MNIEKISHGIKVFVRNQIYGYKLPLCVYPVCLLNSEEKKTVERMAWPLFMSDEHPVDSFPSDSRYK